MKMDVNMKQGTYVILQLIFRLWLKNQNGELSEVVVAENPKAFFVLNFKPPGRKSAA